MRTPWILAGALAVVVCGLVFGCSESMSPDPPPDMTVAGELRTGGAGNGNGDSAGGAAASTGEGWGTLRGTLVLDGAAPALPVLSTGGKDPEACSPDGIVNEALVVGSANQGIKNVVIFARKVSRVHESAEELKAQEAVFDQKECVFLSHVSGVQVGQTVALKNSDPVSHNTNLSPPADQASNQLLAPMGSGTYTFSRAQNTPVPVTCNIHPWMKSYILPRKDPYFAVTDENGAFEIANLPAGEEVEFQVWHESAGDGALEVPGLTNARGRFTQTVPADGEVDLETVKVPVAVFGL